MNTHHLIIGADPMGLGAARQLELKGCHALALAGWANLWLYENDRTLGFIVSGLLFTMATHIKGLSL